MADNSCDAKRIIFDQLLCQFFVEREVGTDESGNVIDRTADLPAFDDVVDPGEAPLEADLPGLPLQNDLRKNVDGPRQGSDIDDRLISSNDFRGLEAAYAFKARP